MLDIKLLRKDAKALEAKLQTKDPTVKLAPILELDEKIRLVITEGEQLQARRNALSKEIGEKKRKGEDVSAVMQEVAGLGDKVAALNHERTQLEAQLLYLLAMLPNLPSDEAKVSPDPKDNVCLKTWGQKREFDFPFKNHVELGEQLKLFDFKRSAKTSGSGWPAYCGMGARLEWALLNYMIDIHIENGFEMWIPPLLVRPEIAYGASYLPKSEWQMFKLRDDDFNLYLIPTAEAILNGLHYDEIFSAEELPKKYMAYTPCFRREAGAAGSQERGLIRMHQFNKVEMFAFTRPEQSQEMFEEMLASAEEILEGLNIHYRSMMLVTGDMSFAAQKTVDVEVWLPGQNRYYEVSSISLCGDFQSRRSQTRFREKEEKPQFVHTLNGSGVATSRLMVALLENNQRRDGTVELPLVLHKYLGGVKEICLPTS
ncbi:MAG: serine--tRNA ligase [Verrucomicrobia bacterium]|nr:serine--tRNA ligase [Verrucomicrobiota bacterium]